MSPDGRWIVFTDPTRATGIRQILDVSTGSRVDIGPGAVILGAVEIGDDVVIGANSVVLDSVPSRSVVAGAPAKVKISNLSDQAFGEFWSAIKG